MKVTRMFPASAEAGVGAFIGGVSLPAILFRAVAALDFGAVDLSLLVGTLVGKLCMVAASIVMGQVARRGALVPPGESEINGGMFAILTTNGDELGLGLPVMGALFPPEQVSLLFLLSSVQMMLFNAATLPPPTAGVGSASSRRRPVDRCSPSSSSASAWRDATPRGLAHRPRRRPPSSAAWCAGCSATGSCRRSRGIESDELKCGCSATFRRHFRDRPGTAPRQPTARAGASHCGGVQRRLRPPQGRAAALLPG